MEGDAGTGRLNPTPTDPGRDSGPTPTGAATNGGITSVDDVLGADHEFADDADDASGDVPTDGTVESGADRRPTRLGRGWLAAIIGVLIAGTAGLGAAGYLAHRAHDQSLTIARNDGAALARAEECVAATQAPDVAVLTASQTKIIECATGDFGVQANLYTGMLVEAYQAADVAVKVADMQGAIERHNPDGSIDVLVAVRVKVSNTEAADQETGYRLRVNMAPVDGTYKVSKLDQVAS